MVWRTTDGNRTGGDMKYGILQAEMTWQEVAQIEALKARDVAMPVVEGEYEFDGGKRKYHKCPICDEYVYDGEVFCRTCGQRLDMENIAL